MDAEEMERVESKGSAVILYNEVTSNFIQEVDDRRDSVRKNFVADITVNIGQENKSLHGRLKNPSIDGMSVASSETIKAGAVCSVEIVVKDRNSKLFINNIVGEIVRSSKETGELAIQFRHHFEWLALFHVYSCKSAEN